MATAIAVVACDEAKPSLAIEGLTIAHVAVTENYRGRFSEYLLERNIDFKASERGFQIYSRNPEFAGLQMVSGFYASMGVADNRRPPIAVQDGLTWCCYGVEESDVLDYLEFRYGGDITSQISARLNEILSKVEVSGTACVDGQRRVFPTEEGLALHGCGQLSASPNFLELCLISTTYASGTSARSSLLMDFGYDDAVRTYIETMSCI